MKEQQCFSTLNTVIHLCTVRCGGESALTIVLFIAVPPIVSLDPSTTPSERTNEKAQSKIWNGFCQEMALIDFLCVFVSPAHLSAARGEKKEGGRRRRRKERGHQRSPSKLRGVSCRCTEIHQGQHLYDSAPRTVPPARSPARLPDCSNIWQRSKWLQNEHLHSSKQPSKRAVLMKVVTIPKHKATLLVLHLFSFN